MPTPRSEKSTTAIVPIEKANPTMWKHSRIGKARAEEFRGLVISTWIRGYWIAMQPPRTRGGRRAFASVPSLPEPHSTFSITAVKCRSVTGT